MSKECYKPDTFGALSTLGENLNKAFNEYMHRVKVVALTIHNMNDLLFSLCTYESIHESSDGVKANAK